MFRAFGDDVEMEEYQQQTVVDKRIDAGQPSLPGGCKVQRGLNETIVPRLPD